MADHCSHPQCWCNYGVQGGKALGQHLGAVAAEAPKAPDDTLTFAEAMALDPSEVEALDDYPPDQPQWFESSAWLYWTAANLRRCRFRRSRPKRSRVEEMAEAFAGGHAADGPTRAMTEAIRAVCEYLREKVDDMIMPTQPVPDSVRKEAMKNLVTVGERHFLEKR